MLSVSTPARWRIPAHRKPVAAHRQNELHLDHRRHPGHAAVHLRLYHRGRLPPHNLLLRLLRCAQRQLDDAGSGEYYCRGSLGGVVVKQRVGI